MTEAATDRFSDARAHLELLMAADQAVPGWRGLAPEQRSSWFRALYEQAAHLDRRHQLGLRGGWWEDDSPRAPLHPRAPAGRRPTIRPRTRPR